MHAVFIELPPFERYRDQYLTDDEFHNLQLELFRRPDSGAVIPGTGGLRKIRFEDTRRGKGKRGGLRIIFYRWVRGQQFWLFTLYNENEMEDLSAIERHALSTLLANELRHRAK